MGVVYFIQDRKSGANLIKIGATGDCPYTRLNQLRNSMTKSRLELLGSIAIPPKQNYYEKTAKRELQTKFESLRDNGDWFRPGLELVNFIRENARPHFCSRSCPDGSSVEEEMRALDEKATAAAYKAFEESS